MGSIPSAQPESLLLSAAANLPLREVRVDVFGKRQKSEYCFFTAVSDLVTAADMGRKDATLPSSSYHE